MIISDAEVRGVHYVLTQDKGGRVPYDEYGLDRFVDFKLYAIKDGHGKEIDSWSIPDSMGYESKTKILGVMQTRSGSWEPVLGRQTNKSFGEKPLVPLCGQKPEVCCKRSKRVWTEYGHPCAPGWNMAKCECGQRDLAWKFPSSDWSEDNGAG